MALESDDSRLLSSSSLHSHWELGKAQRMGLVRDRRAATAEWREGLISETGMCSDHRMRQLPEGEEGKEAHGPGSHQEAPVPRWALLRRRTRLTLSAMPGLLPSVPALPASKEPCFAV